MKAVKDIARDALLIGIVDFNKKFVEFCNEYELDISIADKVIAEAVEKVAEKLEISVDECFDCMEALSE